MLYDAYEALRSLLFPSECMACGCSVTREMSGLCPKCRYEIPLTYYWRDEDNILRKRLNGVTPIVHASAFLFYRDGGVWRKLIHRFKYSGEWQLAYNMGLYYGAELKASGLYDDVDVVVPVPLHAFKTMRRGYNQSTYLAEGIAKSLGVEVDRGSLRRSRNNPTQTRQTTADRWKNVDGLFRVRRPNRLKNKHILLVDDVLTTGATILACAAAIYAVLPEVRVSVAALAAARRVAE